MVVLRIEVRALCMLGKYSNKLHFPPTKWMVVKDNKLLSCLHRMLYFPYCALSKLWGRGIEEKPFHYQTQLWFSEAMAWPPKA